MKLFQFETHCHTAESSPCGILTGEEVADGMKEAEYAGTFITDHLDNIYVQILATYMYLIQQKKLMMLKK